MEPWLFDTMSPELFDALPSADKQLLDAIALAFQAEVERPALGEDASRG